MKKILTLLFLSLFFTITKSQDIMEKSSFMPMPAELQYGSGSLKIDSSFSVFSEGYNDEIIAKGIQRFLNRLYKQTGVFLKKNQADNPGGATLLIKVEGKPETKDGYRQNEDYSLTVNGNSSVLEAESPYGVLRGLETYLQAIQTGKEGLYIPALTINDSPRYPWRGLMLDVCRHWMPSEVVKRNIDGMAALKLNVLHIHLTEDQGFRIESKKYPELHLKGSDGNYFTQEEMKDIIAYAAERGIRVVPEFDMPGHTTSWFVGMPELASQPGPYNIVRIWGIMDPSMDPTKEYTYEVIDNFLGEMTGLFPDPYLHIGGDEVTGKQWDNNPEIQEFMKEHGIKDNHGLQAYFNEKLLAIVQKHGKRMVGWDEIFHEGLPKDILVQSWRGHETLAKTAKLGYNSILSFGYYLDHQLPAGYHYSVDPLGELSFTDSLYMNDEKINTSVKGMDELTPEMEENILGGEACMWAEYISPETIDSRIYPRLAVIAERLWSPASKTNNFEDMYRRMDRIDLWLESTGVKHKDNRNDMLKRIAGSEDYEPVAILVNAVEPVKYYQRGRSEKYTQHTPLIQIIDAARPESKTYREFAGLVNGYLTDGSGTKEIKDQLLTWKENHNNLKPYIRESFLLKDAEKLSETLSELGRLGLEVMSAKEKGEKYELSEKDKNLIEEAKKPMDEVLLKVVYPVEKLAKEAGK